MQSQPQTPSDRAWTPFEQLRFGRDVLEAQGQALLRVSKQLDGQFVDAAHQIANCRGLVVVTGIGKAGLVGQKVSATLASTGTRSQFLHAAEAVHGDLGRVGRDDVVLAFSHSGRSEEVLRITPVLRESSRGLIAVTSSATNPLGRDADWVIPIGTQQENGHLGLAPSTSTTVMQSVGDALALLASQLRGFTSLDFARCHPAGSLGQRLAPVERWMRPLDQCRVSATHQSVRECLVHAARSGRRTGAIMLIDASGAMAGIFTDSDLARLMESRCDHALDQPIDSVMTRRVTTVQVGTRLAEAITILAERKISELPVLDSQQRPVGLLDITDLVGIHT
jgi:arabinose-5-phosphate isomerase